MKTLLSLIIVIIIIFLIIGRSDSDNGECPIKYDTKYIRKPVVHEISERHNLVKIPSFERFYDENMLIHMDRSFFDESNYKSIMRHTNDGALI